MRIWIDEDIIYENHHQLILERVKDPIYVIHEYEKDIGYSKWHHHIIVMPIPGSETYFAHIFFLHQNLMVSKPQIYLLEHNSTMKLIHQIIHSIHHLSS